MPISPFDAHQASVSDYLKWLGAGQTGNPSPTSVPVFTWKNQDFQCNAKLTKQRFLDQGGFQMLDVLVITLLQDMGDPGPQPKDILTYNGKEWRIQIVEVSTGKYPTLHCWDPARGA